MEPYRSSTGVVAVDSRRIPMDVEAQHPAVPPHEGLEAQMRLSEKRAAMMIVSVLIATLTYQATLNPPGGFWQDNNHNGTAGAAINARYHGDYNNFVKCNAVGLFASLATILLLTSATTIKRPIMIWFLMLIMWVSVFSVACSFIYGLRLIAAGTMIKTLAVFLLSSVGLLGIVLGLHAAICVRVLLERTSWACGGRVPDLTASSAGRAPDLEHGRRAAQSDNVVDIHCFRHLASARDQAEIAREILRVETGLCFLRDKDGKNPLHVAAMKGFIQVVQQILVAEPRDKDGKNPLHVAAMKSFIQVVEQILVAEPRCLQEVTAQGETALHLTVRNNRVELLSWPSPSLRPWLQGVAYAILCGAFAAPDPKQLVHVIVNLECAGQRAGMRTSRPIEKQHRLSVLNMTRPGLALTWEQA
ncbi:Ankyrin repeat-containing protein [Nymphaea thermarum]|nr:Ankyrin repeat-containing protein [Nymphaea thermarum]